MVEKPDSIERDEFKSAKWDELTAGRSYSESDVPALELLCQWHAVVQRCIDDMDEAGGMVAYQNEHGDLKALPQLSTMKQASAEIRALNKQLGINDEPAARPEPSRKETTLNVIKFRREEKARAARAANQA
ncbi:P27 family phage terminase small subunit [Eggerthella lenta]|uniref:P27 family phage terminase small subunit n=1 Tax=Eggerthella lenta TaxID=84112 RepID=UPI0022E8DEFB|nr:P27 family phage terminase small subunit [Eggerthella lenta]